MPEPPFAMSSWDLVHRLEHIRNELKFGLDRLAMISLNKLIFEFERSCPVCGEPGIVEICCREHGNL